MAKIKPTIESCRPVLEEALKSGDSRELVVTIGKVVRALRKTTEISQSLGLTRRGFYKSMSPEGNPSFHTVIRVLRKLDFHMTIQQSQGSQHGSSS